MATRSKKPKRELVEIRIPIPVLAFYEGVAEYAGVSIDDVINTILAIELVKSRPTPTQGETDAR
jgi:hypothetical protein